MKSEQENFLAPHDKCRSFIGNTPVLQKKIENFK